MIHCTTIFSQPYIYLPTEYTIHTACQAVIINRANPANIITEEWDLHIQHEKNRHQGYQEYENVSHVSFIYFCLTNTYKQDMNAIAALLLFYQWQWPMIA